MKTSRSFKVGTLFDLVGAFLHFDSNKFVTTLFINLYDQYNDVFEQQLQDNIIEDVPIDPTECKHVYIPHRPVIKTEDNVILKTRIVLN